MESSLVQLRNEAIFNGSRPYMASAKPTSVMKQGAFCDWKSELIWSCAKPTGAAQQDAFLRGALEAKNWHLHVCVGLQGVGGELVAAIEVVRDGEADPVRLVGGLLGQHRRPRLYKARNVAHLDLHSPATTFSHPL